MNQGWLGKPSTRGFRPEHLTSYCTLLIVSRLSFDLLTLSDRESMLNKQARETVVGRPKNKIFPRQVLRYYSQKKKDQLGWMVRVVVTMNISLVNKYHRLLPDTADIWMTCRGWLGRPWHRGHIRASCWRPARDIRRCLWRRLAPWHTGYFLYIDSRCLDQEEPNRTMGTSDDESDHQPEGKIGYMVTPRRIQKRKVVFSSPPSPSSPSSPPTPTYTTTPLKKKITPTQLSQRTNRAFFVSLASLREYLACRQEDVQIIKLHGRLKILACDNIFPKPESLNELIDSQKSEDARVSILIK